MNIYMSQGWYCQITYKLLVYWIVICIFLRLSFGNFFFQIHDDKYSFLSFSTTRDKRIIWNQLAPGNPTLWSGVPVASIQKSFGSSGRDWKPGKKLPIPCKFSTCRFIRYSSTCYGMVRIDPLMANIRNPYFFASPVVNAARFVVVLPCYLNRDLLSGPKGN